MILPILLLLLVLWLLACLHFYRRQDKIIYDPDTRTPDMARASVYPGEIVEISPADEPDLTTHSWYWPAKDGMDTILFFHGNNGNIETRTGWMQFAIKAGWGLLMVGYRGYGGNEGTPNQAGLTADGLAAHDYLTQERGVPASQIHIFGHSLGSGVTCQVAAKRPSASIGLMSPFSTMYHAGFDRYPFLPTQIITRDKWKSIDVIAQVNRPLMIAYCDQDTTVRAKRSLQLYAAAQQPKELLLIPGIDHGDIALSGGPKAIVEFFDRVRASR